MGIPFRTRKSGFILGFRVFTVLSVTLTYVLINQFSRNNPLIRKQTVNPFSRHLLAIDDETLVTNTTKNCTPPAIDEFPSDGLTRDQRQNGFIILHALLACYLFVMLATICDEYFVPAIKKFCDKLKMKEDIAGATVMAMASSSPELFINSVGTFVTEGDLGVGAVVGSAVFNILAVPACCGFFSRVYMEVDWWSLSRDSMMYSVAVISLIVVLEDGKIFVGEAVALILIYSLYILLMCFNDKLSRLAHKCVAKFRRRKYYNEVLGETYPLLFQKNGKYHGIEEIFDAEVTLEDCQKFEESTKIWEWPSEGTTKSKLWWVITWPISFVLYLTTPDCRKYPRLFIITFIMCIIWIGSTSYLVSWIITIIGDTLNIPDSIMGLTFLAAGTSVPEAVSSVIVTRQGHATMGLSSSLGSNTFDILLCLGLPWAVKAGLYPKEPGNNWVDIQSAGINISACALLTTLVLFYLSIALNKYRLDWKVATSCLLTYLGFLVLATIVELNVFFPVNLPTCDR
ncbi:unnamed protein product [Phyllotreta striolata]|uniref:Sodium/calcium exchanger membrane region domain-containing protein n=1 Tax=Phyllotreta striolata TaxID=444603 RepID=A0A9N9TGC9_PHYSR|nr:unnamed protein product [Phyllotreta striolata]